jgi:hypothetical protein
MGERPSHPELLDWLALEFVDKGWSLKQMHRLMLTSRRVSDGEHGHSGEPRHRSGEPAVLARATRAARSRGHPRRNHGGDRRARSHHRRAVDLSVHRSGPVRESSRRTWRGKPDDDPSTWRRSIYVFLKRSIRYPMFETFDQPNLSTRAIAATARRSRRRR